MTSRASGHGRVLGIDVGGTFTDLIMLDGDRLQLAKVPTTPGNQATGVLAAIRESRADVSTIDLIIHGTTATTNALLERRLARTGLITTKGFRDILELGRRTRPQPYGMTGTFEPIIPRNLRLEVPERMDAEGRVVLPLDEQAVKVAAETLLAEGCEAVVIHFLHAYANPDHERRAGDIVAAIWPNGYITLGSALLSESREYERGVTAAVNGAVQPIIHRYIHDLSERLSDLGMTRELLVMNGNGGMVPALSIAREAAKTVMSGPASGVMAAAYIGRRAGLNKLLTYDMGGTSTDVAVIDGADPPVSSEIELEYGLPIHVPMVDVRTVGAGGGSIAYVDHAGLLNVGPDSAGADPGPICYGQGGTKTTISDANYLLGRLDPSRLNAINGGIDPDAIASAFADQIGDRLGLSPHQAAAAVLRIANTKMAGAIRMVSLSMGADPRDYSLFAFGGAGPLHASQLARELSIPRVIIPARPGLTNALGCVVADLRHDYVQTVNQPLDGADIAQLHQVLRDQDKAGRDLISAEPVDLDRIESLHAVDMQFQGQTHLLRIPLPTATPSLGDLRDLFDQHYFARFKVELPEIRPVVVNLATSVIGKRKPIDLGGLSRSDEPPSDKPIGTRDCWFDGAPHPTPVYSRDTMPPEMTLTGPAIIEQLDTTTVLEPGDTSTQDTDGNLIIEIAP